MVSYLVPAWATIARCDVAPGMSLAAYLTPVAVPVSYEKDPDAGAAKPLRAGCCHCWRTARCVCRPRAERDNMMIGPRAAGGMSGERCRLDRCCSVLNLELQEEVVQGTVTGPDAQTTGMLPPAEAFAGLCDLLFNYYFTRVSHLTI